MAPVLASIATGIGATRIGATGIGATGIGATCIGATRIGSVRRWEIASLRFDWIGWDPARRLPRPLARCRILHRVQDGHFTEDSGHWYALAPTTGGEGRRTATSPLESWRANDKGTVRHTATRGDPVVRQLSTMRGQRSTSTREVPSPALEELSFVTGNDGQYFRSLLSDCAVRVINVFRIACAEG